MRTFVIDCGAASADMRRPTTSVSGSTSGVGLATSTSGLMTITRAMLGNVPDVLLDLLEVAAYVYCADQQASRGSEQSDGPRPRLAPPHAVHNSGSASRSLGEPAGARGSARRPRLPVGR